MAHQAHNIPWNILTTNLKPILRPSHGQRDKECSNFYLRLEPGQAGQLRHFVAAFARNIDDHTRSERAKYEETYPVPSRTDILLTDAVVEKISPAVLWFRQRSSFHSSLSKVDPESPKSFCRHQDECSCAVPFRERRVEAFLRQHVQNNCYEFWNYNSHAFYNLEIVKLLLLYGEIEPILRICAHPDNDLLSWQSQTQCYDLDHDLGWEHIYLVALDAYICLNICYCFPELWDSKSGWTATRDYRDTYLYQSMLKHCTLSGTTSEVPMLPHRHFFGIADDHFVKTEYTLPFGTSSLAHFLTSGEAELGRTRLKPGTAKYVSRILRERGIPQELVLSILGFVDQTPRSRLSMPHDPLHLANETELRRYLTYCWKLVIRCNIMAQELDRVVDWEQIITAVLRDRLSSPGNRVWCKYDYDAENRDVMRFI
ncbi:hypothetical protein HIM_08773 [Hirsutella minnesotensis 3608]|uniref:Uncharacterized protein n=1 Tax=Hirsutella minnesotensis 3608 TaxID=1043627 RepID=A0A0F7ZMA0_9HYPO|nr:hypothetical protein HIM_08773 [Hirsutella minnesotensis 3608]